MGAKKSKNTKSPCLCGIMISLEKNTVNISRVMCQDIHNSFFKWFGGGGNLINIGQHFSNQNERKV